MALGYAGDAPGVNLMEQGVCHVVQGRSLSQRAAYARRVGAASMLLLAAVVACATVMGSGSVGEKVRPCHLQCPVESFARARRQRGSAAPARAPPIVSNQYVN